MPQAPVHIRIEEHVSAVAPEAWNALLDQSPQPTPFMRHEYLASLIDSGSATADTGWAPLVLLLEDAAGALQAACIAWIKSHSYGEYVFDWAWADAYQRHGLDYYPKLLVAVPFTPVPGSRLLARDASSRRVLLQALRQLAQQQGFSSVHLLFGDEADHAAAEKEGWMPRSGVQFHWLNDGQPDFTAYLASMQRDKRKKIQQEQRRVREAGIAFETLHGAQISDEDWNFFHRCYRLTYRAHHSSPYLNRDFFARMAADMPEHWLMFLAPRVKILVAPIEP